MTCSFCREPEPCRCLEPCPKCGTECDCEPTPDVEPVPMKEDVVLELLLCAWGGRALRAVLSADDA